MICCFFKAYLKDIHKGVVRRKILYGKHKLLLCSINTDIYCYVTGIYTNYEDGDDGNEISGQGSDTILGEVGLATAN